MLVLSRKPGEAITIAGNITVRLVHVGNGRVRLGIEAPREVAITRGELRASASGAATVANKLVLDYTSGSV